MGGYIEPGFCFSSLSLEGREMGRKPCCSKEGLNRGAWTAVEDEALRSYIKAHGEGMWRNLPKRAGLKRCGKSCRLRWLNYLRPDIKRGNISEDEEELIIRLHRLLGNRWSLIAGRLPGRTDNEIKNYWNTTLSKKVRAQSPASSPPPPPSKKSRAGKKEPPKTSIVDHPSPSDPTCSRVIVPKATRCTRVVFVDTSTPATSELQPLRPSFFTDSDDSNGGSDKETDIPVRNFNMSEFQRSNAGADEGYDYMNELYVDPEQHLPLEEAIFEDWRFNYSEKKACLELDSFDFLFDSQEWA